jgi:guanidinopropionase
MGVEAVGRENFCTVGTGPTYLSIDIDSMDSAFAPGTGTPEFGGLTSVEDVILSGRCEVSS